MVEKQKQKQKNDRTALREELNHGKTRNKGNSWALDEA
jgi:hypothetical protein